MYPSLFPLRFKRPWHAGGSSLQGNVDDAANAVMWLRETGEQGLNSLNFQSLGMLPWMQPSMDPMLTVSSQNQQYQAMLSSGLQNLRSRDPLNPQLMQFQQPFQYLQLSSSQIPLLQQQQQLVKQSLPQQILHAQSQISKENFPQQIQQLDYYKQQGSASNQQLCTPKEAQPSDVHSSISKMGATNTNAELSTAHASTQNVLGSLHPDEISNLSNLSMINRTVLSEQASQQPLVSLGSFSPVNVFSDSVSLPPYPGKEAPMDLANSTLDVQNHHDVFGANTDSSGLMLPMTVPTDYHSTSMDANINSMPSAASGFQSSLYGYMQSSQELPNAGQIDLPSPTQTFVKVYKSGSVGRSLDISRFSSYHELREELGRMFGIEGKLEDPLRSGWQLVFVDKENDELLLGDDPWESFVNNVWYIKILSPEDVRKLGNRGSESFS
ncbi:hypothetical protein Ancab_001046 [Ancistrocladus abbreviatus]